ncbi:TIM barrel protein [Arthrobacter sp. R1-13]
MVQLDLQKIELWCVAPHLHVPDAGPSQVGALRRKLRERGLSLVCLTPEQVAYPVNIASGGSRLRKNSVQLFLRAAEICSELESPLLFLTSGRGYEDEDRMVAWGRSVESLQRITARASSLGVDCVLEPLQRTESNLVTTVAELHQMISDVGSPRLGGVLDTVAMAVAGDEVNDYTALLDGRLRHVHLVDGKPAGHLAWGDGSLDLPGVLRHLGLHGYADSMTFELFGDGSYGLDPLAALTRCLDAFDEAAAVGFPARTGR